MNRRAFIAIASALPLAVASCAPRSRLSGQWTRLTPLPNVLGVAAPFAGVGNGTLLVAGGANFPDGFPWEGGRKVWHDLIYQPATPKGRWGCRRKAAAPAGVWSFDHHAARTRLCGRQRCGQALPGRISFVHERRYVAPRIHACPAFASRQRGGRLGGNRRILVGGSAEPGEHSALNQLWALDLSRLSAGWRELEPLPAEPRFLPVAASRAGDFFLFGGVGLTAREGKPQRVYLRDVWRYRSGDGWRRVADLPHPLAAAPSPAPVVGGEILLLPGDDGSQFDFQPAEKHPGFPRSMLAYDIRRNTWRDAGEAPFAHVTTSCVDWRGRFLIPSGEVRPGVRSPEVWSLMPP